MSLKCAWKNKINIVNSFDEAFLKEKDIALQSISFLFAEDNNLNKEENGKRKSTSSRNINSQELYKNFDNAEKRMHRNILQEEYKMRGDLINTRYKNLMEKDKNFSMQIEENTSKYKKMLIEKSFDIVED